MEVIMKKLLLSVTLLTVSCLQAMNPDVVKNINWKRAFHQEHSWKIIAIPAAAEKVDWRISVQYKHIKEEFKQGLEQIQQAILLNNLPSFTFLKNIDAAFQNEQLKNCFIKLLVKVCKKFKKNHEEAFERVISFAYKNNLVNINTILEEVIENETEALKYNCASFIEKSILQGNKSYCLFVAAYYNAYESAEILLRHKVPFSDFDMQQSLNLAIEYNNEKMVRLLIEYGANPYNVGFLYDSRNWENIPNNIQQLFYRKNSISNSITKIGVNALRVYADCKNPIITNVVTPLIVLSCITASMATIGTLCRYFKR